MHTLKGVFSHSKPPRRNFIQENVRQLREMTNYWQSKEGDEQLLEFPQKLNKYMNVPAKVPPHVTGAKAVTVKKSPELQNLKSKTRNMKTQPKGLAVSKSSPGKQPAKPLKQPRKVRAGVRNKPLVDDSRLREGDVAEYVRKQRETVLSKRVENGYSDSDLSLDETDSDSVEYIKPPMSSFNRRNAGVAHKSTACQTVEADRLDSLYDEGIIRYPSAMKTSGPKASANDKISFRNMGQQTERSQVPASRSSPPPVGRRDRQSATLTNVMSEKSNNLVDADLNLELNDSQQRGADFIRMNAKAASAVQSRIPAATSRSDRLKPPSTYQRGIVPRYLQKRQTQWQKEDEQKQQDAPDPTCPPGHVPLPEAERKESLKMLRKSYADLVHELNTLPVRADTLRIRQRKMDIEKQLNKLEEGIKVFSRPKVFVKIGD